MANVRYDHVIHEDAENDDSAMAETLGAAVTELLVRAGAQARELSGSIAFDTLSIERSPGPEPLVTYILSVRIGVEAAPGGEAGIGT